MNDLDKTANRWRALKHFELTTMTSLPMRARPSVAHKIVASAGLVMRAGVFTGAGLVTSVGLFTSAGLLTSTLLATSNAHAEQGCGETSCDLGYTCQSYEVGCADILIDIACPEGEQCSPPANPDCETSTQFYCAPAACDSDSDCAPYMKCASFEAYDCPESAPIGCAEGESDEGCAARAREQSTGTECTTKQLKECTAKWNLPCQQASDCGAGFECVPELSCTCSGSAGVGADSGQASGASDPQTSVLPVEEECSCQPGDTNYCQVIEQACVDDADCPQMWTCGENYNGLCAVDSAGNSDCSTQGPDKVCYPPQQDFAVLATAELAASGNLADGDASSAAGVAEQPARPASANGASSGVVADDKAQLATESDGTSDNSAVDDPGCSVTAPGSKPAKGSLAALVFGLGLAFVRRRAGQGGGRHCSAK